MRYNMINTLIVFVSSCVLLSGAFGHVATAKSNTQTLRYEVAVHEDTFRTFIKEIENDIKDQALYDQVMQFAVDRAYVRLEGLPKNTEREITQTFVYRKNVQDQSMRQLGRLLNFFGDLLGMVSTGIFVREGNNALKKAPWGIGEWYCHRQQGCVAKAKEWFPAVSSWIANGKQWVVKQVPSSMRALTSKLRDKIPGFVIVLGVSLALYFMDQAKEGLKEQGMRIATKPSKDLVRVHIRICKLRCP